MSGAAFSISVKTPGAIAGGGAAALTIIAGTNRPRIKRIEAIVHASPVASAVDVYRVTSANFGIATLPSLWQGCATQDVGLTGFGVVWSVAPTLPAGAVALNGVSLAGVIGNGAVMNFPDSEILEPGTALLLWCALAASQLRFNIFGEE